MAMALPEGIPTLQHKVTKKYSSPDNFFCMDTLIDRITKCGVEPTLCPTSTDHFPIITKIQATQTRVKEAPSFNFKAVD